MKVHNKKPDITFENNGKVYNLYVEETISGYITEEGVEKEISEREDIVLVETVLESLRPNLDDSIELDTITLENKKYKILLDKKKFLYFFYEFDNDNYIVPKPDVISKLNFMYNHIEVVKNDINTEERIETPLDFQRKIRLGNKIISIFTAATVLLNLIPKEHKWKIDYTLKQYTTELNDAIDKLNYIEFRSELIKTALDNNKSLTDEERAFLSSIDSIIEENKDYVDLKSILDNLEEIKIEYKSGNKETDTFLNTLGNYTTSGSNKNTITIYNSTSFEDCSKTVLLHEIAHSFSETTSLSNLPTPFGELFYVVDTASSFRVNILEETVNELFSREYFSYLSKENSEFQGYSTYMPLIYALCEIIDPEVIREYKFTQDASLLIKALESIDGNIDKAYTFLTNFTTLRAYHAEVYKNQTDENILLYYNKTQEMFNNIKYYYEKKHGIPMESDIVMCVYFYSTIYSNTTISNNVRAYFGSDNSIDMLNIIPRSYLAKNGNLCMRVECTEDNRTLTYEIDDTNRYINYDLESLPNF